MKKYIDADKIHDVMASHFCACSDETEVALHSVWDELEAIPGEDVAEVRRGKWKGVWWSGERAFGQCSECHETGELRTHRNEWGVWEITMHFCPDCGVLMEPTP